MLKLTDAYDRGWPRMFWFNARDCFIVYSQAEWDMLKDGKTPRDVEWKRRQARRSSRGALLLRR